MKKIGFSGIDGSEKTTQISLVQNALLEIGESSIIYKHRFKQPSDNTVPLSKLDECLDLLSDYSGRFSHFIHSYSHQHNYILCDRSILCYLVYALVDFNLDESEFVMLVNAVSKDVIPHCTVLFETPVDVAIKRIETRIEKPPDANETIDKLIQYKRVYESISKSIIVPNIHTINGFNTMNAIIFRIMSIITNIN